MPRLTAELKPSEKYAIIREMTSRDDNLLKITHLLEIAGVSKSGYYDWIKQENYRLQREIKDRSDFEIILNAYNYRGYKKGARGIYMRLLHESPPVVMNIKKIRRLMKKYDLKCPIRKPNPYKKFYKISNLARTAPNILNREFEEHGPRTILLTDITYLFYKGGQCYLSVIIDCFTKQVLAYKVSQSLAVDFVLETVNELMDKHGSELNTDVLLHCDQGVQYRSYSFVELLQNKGIRQSMSNKGVCWDNAPQESFFGHMKDELVISDCSTIEEVIERIDDWMDYYNNERYVWELQKMSPNEYWEYLKNQ